MAWVLKHSPLKGQDKLVLLGIANHADPAGLNAWPSVETLAVYASASERTVQRILVRLEAGGHIVVHRRQGGPEGLRGDRRPNLYEVVILPEEDPDGVTDVVTPPGPHEVTDPAPRGDKSAPRGDKSASRGDTQAVTQTSIEPSVEPSSSNKASSTRATDRGTRIPDDFALTHDMIAWARENTPNVGRPDHDAFVDYWRTVPGAKGRKVDWLATWRGWMRRENERRGGHPQPARRSTTSERIDQVDAAFDELKRRGDLAIGAPSRREIGAS